MTRTEALTELKAKVLAGTDTMPDHTACYSRDEDGLIIGTSWNDRASFESARCRGRRFFIPTHRHLA